MVSNFLSWPENSRLALTRAIVELGSFEIGEIIEKTLPRDFSRFDQATSELKLINSKIYSDKPPGLSFAAIPAYFIARTFVGGGIEPLDGIDYGVLLLFVVGGTAALGNVWIFLELIKIFSFYKISRPQFWAAAYSLGTINLLYAGMFFQYTIAGALILISFRKIFLESSFIVGGVVLAISVYFDYLCLGFFAISFILRPKISFFVSLLLGLVPLLNFHYLITGSPFILPYFAGTKAMIINDSISSLGSGTVTSASDFTELLHRSFLLLFYPFRGLFFFVPVLLLCFFGRFRAVSLSFLAILLLATAYKDQWWLGVSYGPRYLLIVAPLLYISAVTSQCKRALFLGLFLALIQTLGGIREWAYFPPGQSGTLDFKCYNSVLYSFKGGFAFHFQGYLRPLLSEGVNPVVLPIVLGLKPIPELTIRLDHFGLTTCK